MQAIEKIQKKLSPGLNNQQLHSYNYANLRSPVSHAAADFGRTVVIGAAARGSQSQARPRPIRPVLRVEAVLHVKLDPIAVVTFLPNCSGEALLAHSRGFPSVPLN